MGHLKSFLCELPLLIEDFTVVSQYEISTLSSLGWEEELPADVVSPGKFRAALIIESGMACSRARRRKKRFYRCNIT